MLTKILRLRPTNDLTIIESSSYEMGISRKGEAPEAVKAGVSRE
jgi:hypothetical protein